MMQHQILISIAFPHKSVQECKTLLHTPELWGSGPLLLLGVPRFRVQNPHSLILAENEKHIAFRALHRQVRLVSSHEGKQVDIRVDGLMHIKASIYDYNAGANQGHVLTLAVDTEKDLLLKENIENCLRHSLWQGLETVYAPLPGLVVFRNKTL